MEEEECGVEEGGVEEVEEKKEGMESRRKNKKIDISNKTNDNQNN